MPATRSRPSGSLIVDVDVDPRRPSRCRLQLADGSGVALATLDAERLGLGPGRRWDRAARRELDHLQRVQRARTAALRALARRSLPAAAVEGRLRAAGFRPREIRATLQSLREDLWIDDRRWAAARLATLRQRSLCSRRTVRDALRQAGIPAGIVREVLERGYSRDDEAEAIAARLARSSASRRLVASLLRRRGFPKTAIARAAAMAGRGGTPRLGPVPRSPRVR